MSNAIKKLINAEGQFLVKLTMVTIQNSQGCCTFQMSLVYNRVCWDSFDVASVFSVLKNEPRGLRDFSGHFLGSREDGRLVFAWFWGSGELGEGRLG
jgi:hypothetical protein